MRVRMENCLITLFSATMALILSHFLQTPFEANLQENIG